jgi:predicted kinase
MMETIIFCGIQASGKSTFYIEKFFKTHFRISMDLLNTRNKENIFLRTCFMTRQRFVVDNTNPTKAERKRYIELARSNKFRVTGYFFHTTVKDALARNSARAGKEKIPIAGLIGTYKKLQPPDYSEGFDELFQVEITEKGFEVRRV